MTEMLPSSLEDIYQLIDSDRCVEALERIAALAGPEAKYPIVLLYKALCLYEAKDDLECLRLLEAFVKAAPEHKKVPYALFTSAVCLQNLGLHEQALNILVSLPKSYPDLESAVAHSRATLETARTAEAIYELLRKHP
ncbi:MAG: tetratricopeptide repeat protein [Acidobacteria bacterium]|nr:tetratricopeptide repeat protein [Acidobacteriota bacterium]